jgi:hypothetical protein
MNLKTIEIEINKVKDQKNNWRKISYLLNLCQETEAFKSDYPLFIRWVESLNDKMGLKKSSLIRVKSAGQTWLQLMGKTDLSQIENCPTDDSRIFTDYKTLVNKVSKGELPYTTQKMTGVRNQVINNNITRSDIAELLNNVSEDAEIKNKIIELKKLSKGNDKAQAMLMELETLLVA